MPEENLPVTKENTNRSDELLARKPGQQEAEMIVLRKNTYKKEVWR